MDDMDDMAIGWRRRPVAIRAEALVKRFGDVHALAGFDLAVPAGQVCGLLGPNGAGKSTAVRILTTLLRSDGGWAEVAGVDVASDPHEVRRRIGLSGQEPAVDEILSGRQNVVLFARLAGMTKASARTRAEELLEMMELTEAAGRSVKHYSGGMRRRLDLAVTLILAPEVLFLDEPTTGLDPRNRAEVWRALRAHVDGGTTVLLTTQYLDEADQLADQIAVIDRGMVIADGTPDSLKAQIGGDRLEVVVAEATDVDATIATIARVASGPPDVEREQRRVSAHVVDPVDALVDVIRRLADAGIAVADVGLRRPTLDDVFLELTGHTARAAAEEEVEDEEDARRREGDGTDEPEPGSGVHVVASARSASEVSS